jgi:hypothetical protein
MHLRSYSIILSIGFLFLINGCLSSKIEPVSAGYDYFPLETGQYAIYDLTEQYYSLNAAPVQRTYQLKEVVGDSYLDVTGNKAFRLMRYRRSTANQPWQADSVWSTRLVNNEAIRTENGLDFVKLLFPVSDQLTWDGNRLNSAGNDDYQLRNSRQPYRVSDKQYDETVTVIAQNDSTLVSQDKRIDIYARQIGLIYKERTQLQFCSSSPGCIGKYQIDYGIRQIYRIQQYGKE